MKFILRITGLFAAVFLAACALLLLTVGSQEMGLLADQLKYDITSAYDPALDGIGPTGEIIARFESAGKQLNLYSDGYLMISGHILEERINKSQMDEFLNSIKTFEHPVSAQDLKVLEKGTTCNKVPSVASVLKNDKFMEIRHHRCKTVVIEGAEGFSNILENYFKKGIELPPVTRILLWTITPDDGSYENMTLMNNGQLTWYKIAAGKSSGKILKIYKQKEVKEFEKIISQIKESASMADQEFTFLERLQHCPTGPARISVEVYKGVEPIQIMSRYCLTSIAEGAKPLIDKLDYEFSRK
jgi:hypothetical protein